MTEREMKEAVERIVKIWVGQQRAERGDKFATVEEMKSICCDPLGWLELLRGYDAYDVLRLAIRRS